MKTQRSFITLGVIAALLFLAPAAPIGLGQSVSAQAASAEAGAGLDASVMAEIAQALPAQAVLTDTYQIHLPLLVRGPSMLGKVGLVADVGGITDKSFNQGAWEGLQQAALEFGFSAQYKQAQSSADYATRIDEFAADGYSTIVTVGFMMGDATAVKARQYPNIKFAIVDNAYFPTTGSVACPDTVHDCYVDGGLTNVTSLMFQEDQAGFLAGVVAGGMSVSGTICSVAGMEIPPVVRFVVGYQNGAKWLTPTVQTLNVYIPSFVDPATGKSTAQAMIAQGCDVVFGVGGNTGNGGLLAAKESGVKGVGVDVDQYYTYPEVKDILLTSAMKNVNTAVYEHLKAAVNSTAHAGIITANVQNGGVGLSPYHDWDSRIPLSVKNKVQEALLGLQNGTIDTGYHP